MFKAFKDMISRWNDFKGKTGVADYWLATLANVVLSLIVGLVISLFFVIIATTASSDAATTIITIFSIIIGIAGSIFYIWILIAGLAMTVRRIRDAGFPWWFIFVNFVPSIGQIALIVFCCLPSVNEPRIDFGTSDNSAPANPPKPVDTEVIDLEPAEDSQESDGTWVCQNCGAENSSNFCSACGSRRP